MKKLILASIFLLSLLACTEDIDKGNRYTFTEETVADYLLNRSEKYSHMITMLKRAEIFTMLNTYGQYTLFLPDNATIENYLWEQDSIYWATKDTFNPVWTGITSPLIEDLSDSMATVIASNHVVEAMYRTTEMGEGALGTRNFNKRLLGINYIVKGERFYIMLNNNAAIIGGDNQVENGIIHLVDKVIDPSLKNIPELIQTTGFFKIFTSAMNLTGFADSLRKHLDESYDYTQHTIFEDIRFPQYVLYPPETRYFKYTGFIEPDEVFDRYGIHNIDDLISFAEKWYGTEEKGNYKNPKNSLYKFVAYHFVERELPHNKIVPYNVYPYFEEYLPTTYDRYDYFETMMGTIMKVVKPLSTPDGRDTYINYSKRKQPFNTEMLSHINVRIIPLTEFVKMKGVYAEFDQMASNGIIHPIDKILLYNEDEMAGNILNERIRIDLLSLIPELSSNNARYSPEFYCLPDIYSEKVKIRSGTVSIYTHATSYNMDLIALRGDYDIEFTLPPLPPRVYEIRLGFNPNSYDHNGIKMGQIQVYIDGKVEGMPFGEIDDYTGRIEDSETYDNGVENDKLMRSLGWMKAPLVYLNGHFVPARHHPYFIRRIITKKYLDTEPHRIRFRIIGNYYDDPYQQMDYLEFVPLHIINDPAKPEDRY